MNRTALTFLVSVLILAGILLFLTALADVVILMGHNIPQEDMATDYFIGVTWALFIGLSIILWPVPGRDKRPLLWAWLAKCLVALGFMLIYENHYPTDAMGYYSWGKDPNYLWSMFVIGEGTENMFRLTHLHSRILPDSFHMMKVSFSLIGFIALYLFYRAGVQYTDKEDNRVFYSIMLFPTHIFWSSIIGKDPVILLGIALYVYGVASWHRTNNLRYLLIIGLGVFETSFIRVWMSSILLAPLAVFFISKMRGFLPRLAFICLVLFGFGWTHSKLRDKFKIETSEDLVKTADSTFQSWAYGGSAQVAEARLDSTTDMIMFFPIGAGSALLRPLPGEVANLFGTLAGLENLAFLILLFYAFFRSRARDILEPMVLWATMLILAWSASYAFVSYQNLGSAARFKLQIMPVFLGLIMYLSRRRTAAVPAAASRAPSLAAR